jgi:hypothetical protein
MSKIYEKKFSDSWIFPNLQQKKIVGAHHFYITETNDLFHSGRKKYSCTYYDKNGTELKKYICMKLISKSTGKEYDVIKVE